MFSLICNVNIQNAQAAAYIVNWWMDVLEKQSNVLWQKMYGANGLGVWGHLNLQTHDKCSLWTGNGILFLTDDEWIIFRISKNNLWQKMSHSRGFQPKTFGFMSNALPFEVDSDLSLCQTE